MVESFFECPTLNVPYICPGRHCELKAEGQPTSKIIDTRRRSALIIPLPKPRKRRRAKCQPELGLGDADGLSTTEPQYNPMPIINEFRQSAATWRNLPDPSQWRVTHEAECLQSRNIQNVG